MAQNGEAMADNLTIRQMPYSLEAEQALLGAVISDAEKLNEVPFLKTADFYLSQHQTIYSILTDMYRQSKRIDMVTLLDELGKAEALKGTDLVKYIKLLVESAAFSSNIEEHAKIIRDKAVLRTLIDVSQGITEDAYSAAEDVDIIVGNAEQRIYDISNSKYTEGFSHISEAIKEDLDILDRRANDPESLMGVSSHYKELDNILRLGKGDLIIVGGRPGMGKTTFAMNIGTNVAKTPLKDGTMPEVVVFSLEMTKQQLAERILSSEALVDSNSLMKGSITTEMWKKLADAAGRLSKTQLLLDESSNITVTEMKAKLRRLKNLGLVIIDYLQLMHSERHTDNRVLEIGNITRDLKLMAKDLGVPVILCSQLRRESNATSKPGERMPQISDLRDSGAIEQDADAVILLHRDDYYGANDSDGGIPVAKAIVAKNRHGAPGTVSLSWYGSYFKFVSVETRYEDK